MASDFYCLATMSRIAKNHFRAKTAWQCEVNTSKGKKYIYLSKIKIFK